MPLVAGTRLARYEVLGPLGAGGMGEVYHARDSRIGRDVAIKLLPSGLADDPERLRRFEQEARAAGVLNHPNILTIYDVGSVAANEDAALKDRENSPYIVSELLEGQTLRRELAAGSLPESVVLDYASQIASGLAAAHEKGIVHRDLKPENIFVSQGGRVKILDFGLAKLVRTGSVGTDGAPVDTASGVVLGTAGYMSPEQVRAGPIDQRSDIFSFGAILYEMLSGRRAFQRGTAVETLNAILHEEPPALPTDLSAATPGLPRLVRRCLQKDPERRFQSARDLAFDLEGFSQTASFAAAVTAGTTSRPLSSLSVAALSGAVLASAILGWTLWRGRSPAPSRSQLSAPRVTPFLSSTAIEKQPAWSPNGDLIAYVSDAAGNDDVWISDLSGANPINLTGRHGGGDAFPAWSPDGQRIAFYSERDGGGIYTMTALGGDVRKLLHVKPGVLYTFSLRWPRDELIVYTNFDDAGRKQVYRVSPMSPAAVCLSCPLRVLDTSQSGDLSPSGDLLAFKSGEMGPRGELYVAHVATGRTQLITSGIDEPRWSPDGNRLLFISARDGISDVWQVSIDRTTGKRVGEVEALTSGLNATAFTTSPDGRQVLAVKGRSTSSLWSFPSQEDRISSLDLGHRLTHVEARDGRGRWFPDGRGLLFESDRRGSRDVWRLAGPEGAPGRLTSGPGIEHRPRPSPDGRWIAVDVVDSRGEFVHLMRPDGSDLHMLDTAWPTSYRRACCADWSPDASQLVIHMVSKDGRHLTSLVSVDGVTGRATHTRILDLPGAMAEYHRFSPDGRFIVYESVKDGSWDLWIADPDGRNARRLTSAVGNERSAAWRSQPLTVYFVKDERHIWRISMSDSGEPLGEPEPWLTLSGRRRFAYDSIDVTRSGERVLLTIVDEASDIWLVELGRR